MLKRLPPPTLIWLAGLITLSFAVSVIAGVVMYLQTRHIAEARASETARGAVQRGQVAVARYGCGSCHTIPGVDGAVGQVGPDLTGIGRRTTLAGQYSNQPAVMIRWLEHPQRLRPGSGMPEMGVRPQEARDIAAYLYSRP